MVEINKNFLKLKAGYLFPMITKRVNAYLEANPKADIIRMGIGDVTEPLPEAVRSAMVQAVDDMGRIDGFKGYGPEQGYDWLRQAIVENDYTPRGCDITADEIFVSDGSKCDSGNILDIFGPGNTVAIPDPVYPVYLDTNIMAGQDYDDIVYLPMTAENNFSPDLPDQKVDLIYLCYPNNPTGAVASREDLKKWVDYARENGSVIMFDAAYAAFIQDADIPHSIYEIEGAKECAIEFRSFSKNAGFTGTRCAFTVVPKALVCDGTALHDLWNRRHCTKFNGTSYVTQRGAAAVYTPEGKQQVGDLVAFYMENARIIRDSLTAQGLEVFGGENAPYIWIKTPGGLDSWAFFDALLDGAGIVGTPGAGFGPAGEGYFRLSAFNSRAKIEEAMARLQATKLAA